MTSWKIGIPMVAVAVWASLRLHPPGSNRFSVTALPGFALFFVFNSIKAGAQVALMALRPRIKLQPAILDIPLQLEDEAAQIFLASLLSLLPGTLSAGLVEGGLKLHVLDDRLPTKQSVLEAELQIARLLKLELR